MIKRIVKMSFASEGVAEFIQIFNISKPLIMAFEGCHHVELLQCADDTGIFFTFSTWESEAHLEAYRNSELFAGVWARTKRLFKAKASAWTVVEQNPKVG